MKKLLLTVIATVILGCFLGRAQSTNTLGTINQNATIVTNPNTNLSQFEIRGNKLITQNFQISPTGTQVTGNFTTNARWNSMGSLNAGSQILNGFRTQTDGRALTTGFSIPTGGTVQNPTIQWIGNVAGANITPGNLDFKYANSPGSPGFPQTDVTMFVMAPTPLNSFLPLFSYASKGALIGQLENGTLGNFGIKDRWSATGQVITPNFLTYGTRHQYGRYTFNSGLLFNSNSGEVNAVIDYGSNFPAGAGLNIFKFRSFTDPTDLNSVKNIWQSGNKFNNIVLGRQDYNNVNSSQFYLSLFDGQTTNTGAVANSFIKRAGILATSDGLDEFGNDLGTYAAIVGDVSKAGNAGLAHIGVLGISSDDPDFGDNKWAGYFAGSVVISGTLVNPSDKKFKTDITDEKDMMTKLMLLKPKNYLFDTKNNKNMAFSSKLQHGLISQEVEAVFPELVQDIYGPSSSSNEKENGKPMQYKGLNYVGMIPMLLQGIQEQQAEIVALKEQIKSSTTLVLNNQKSLPVEITNQAFSLSQNIPNPFTESTTISYTIPQNVSKALLAIFDLNGKMLLQYNLQQGKNQVTINGSQLTAGMYIYSLIADGAEVVSKRMILTK